MDFQLTHVDEQYAPPGKVLDISVIGDVVSIAVRTYTETHATTALTTQAEILVDLTSLLGGLAMSASDDRQRAKRRAEEDAARARREREES